MSKMQRNLDGIYFRVEGDGKWTNVCYSDMEQRFVGECEYHRRMRELGIEVE